MLIEHHRAKSVHVSGVSNHFHQQLQVFITTDMGTRRFNYIYSALIAEQAQYLGIKLPNLRRSPLVLSNVIFAIHSFLALKIAGESGGKDGRTKRGSQSQDDSSFLQELYISNALFSVDIKEI